MISLLLCLALQEDLTAEFEKLEKDYKAAVDVFYKPWREAKTDEERKKVKLDEDKAPSREFLPKFKDLAGRAKGTDAGLRALMWILHNPQPGDSNSAGEAVDAILASYVESPKLESFVLELRNAGRKLGEDKVRDALKTLAEKSPHADVRAAALFAQAMMVSGKEPAEAKRMLEAVQKDYADTKYAKQAAGYIFEIEHLQIGMEAPDFDATDLDGKAFKLSDYRGKVVVLDFWGFW